MFLVQPQSLSGDAPLPGFAIRAYAQVLSEDLARQMGVMPPQVNVAHESSNHITFENALLCQSPVSQWMRMTEYGDLVLHVIAFTPLQLQFAIGHTLAHLVRDMLEWECDLAALDWMNDPEVPFSEPTLRAIVETPLWRAQALRFRLGERVIAVGDALMSGVWQTPLFQD